MTVESGHEPTEWASVPRPISQPTPAAQSVHYNSARHGSHVEESPELLRWRADLLMDEMMMGGVDVSAADGNRTFSGVDAPIVQRPQAPIHGGAANGGSNGGGNGGSFQSDHGRTPRDGYERNPYENGSRTSGGNGAVTPPTTYPNGSYGNGSQNYSQNNSQPNNIQSNSSQNFGTQSRDTSAYDNRSYESRPYDAPSNSSPTHASPADGYVPYAREPQGNGTPSTSYPRPGDSSRPVESDNSYTSPAPNRDLGGEPRALETRLGDVQPYDEPLRQPPTRPTPPATPVVGPDSSGSNEAGYTSYNKSGYDQYESGNQRNSAPYGYESYGDGGETGGRTVRREDNTSLNQVPPSQSTLRTPMDGSPTVNRGEQAPRSAEPPYEPYLREAANLPRAEPPTPAMATRPPLTPLSPVEPPTRPATPPRVTPQPVDQHTQWATGPDKWEYQDFSSNPDEAEEPSILASYPAPDRRVGQESAVRSDPAQFVGAMSMGNKKRSTLLPRSSTLDVDTLHREISDLHGEIAALLPVGNETGERARHLLDKAYSILQSDPMRSAEVEYYMQQVRTIVQRLYQARQWSDLYRQRLHVYLWGWLGLSAVMIIARFLFQVELERSMMWLAGVYEDHFLVTHWATFIGTAFAGALGGAIGALYTMQTHARGEYSFFDRKYGLRGLILPFMGLIVGALGYLIFGLIFAMVGINPAQSLTATIVPTMAAFAFGFSQESIYGTRN